MNPQPEFAWADVEKAIHQLAGMLDESTKNVTNPNLRGFVENLSTTVKQNVADLGQAISKFETEAATKRAEIEKYANEVLVENQSLLDQARAYFANLKPSAAPAAVEPETEPGSRLRRELLERYGLPDSAPADSARSRNWESWFDSTTDAGSDARPPSTAAQPENAWKPFFQDASPAAPAKTEIPKPADSQDDGSKTEAERQGWSTWMDDPMAGD